MGIVARAGIAAGIFLLLTGGFVLTSQLIARHRRKIFLEGLGGVVRIGTPCRVVSGRALVPGTVALVPSRLCWDAPFGLSGQFTFEEIRRLETDEKTQAQRGFFRSKILRVTTTSGEAREFVLSPGHAWEWRQALGEWTSRKGAIAGAATT
jgi:hypothetical protein